MFCSRSVASHLLRGAAALAMIAGALFFSECLGAIGSAVALVGAVLLMRGCPMCWLVGLLEALTKRRNAGRPHQKAM